MPSSHLLTSGDRVRLHDAANGTVQWDAAVYPSCRPVVVSEGIHDFVLVGDYDGWVYKLGFATGVQQEKLDLASPHVAQAVRGVAYSDGVVYASLGSTQATGDWGLYAYKLGGEPLWKRQMDYLGWGQPVVVDGIVYAGSWDGRLYAVNVDGTDAWISTVYNYFACQPVVVDGTVYAGPDSKLVALDAKSGAVLWEAEADNQATIVDPIEVGGGRVYVATGYGARICAFDAAQGTLLWSVAAGGHPTTPRYWNGHLYVATEHGAGSGYLRAFDAATGQMLWQSTVPVGSSGDAVSRPVVDDGPVTNNVFVTSQDGFAYAFESNFGTLQWTSAVGGGWPEDATWTDATGSRARMPFTSHRYAAVDPLALVLKSDIYVKINLPRPQPLEMLTRRVRRLAREMTADDRRRAIDQLQRLSETARVLTDAIEETVVKKD